VCRGLADGAGCLPVGRFAVCGCRRVPSLSHTKMENPLFTSKFSTIWF